MGRALHVAERRFVRRILAVDIQRDFDYHDLDKVQSRVSKTLHFRNLCLSCQSTSASKRTNEFELVSRVANWKIKLLNH